MTSTDDEHDLKPKSGALWEWYEKDVRALLDKIDGSKVTHNVKRTGVISKVERQIDVLVEGSVTASRITIAVECKHYAKPLGIGKIDEFAGKLADLEVDQGILYALSGVTSGAQARADGAYPKIEIRNLAQAATPPRSWEQYLDDALKFGDCGSPTCPGGEVDWSEWPQSNSISVKALRVRLERYQGLIASPLNRVGREPGIQ
ncbi:restriction endonuclease [Arthrobacter sp. MP_2.3]|uniref:restriction endonuclease n=1 Tax=Arthrobacter sp. MP_2.3 TaxID=3349633 RepID=UPI0038D3DE67